VARFDRTIPPGGEGKITLEIKTQGFQGNIHKTARVMTNDPKNPQTVIGLAGTVWVPVQVSPQYGHLKGIVGEMPETMISLAAQKKEPLKLEIASISIPDKIEVELMEKEKGRQYQVRIKNKVQGVATYNGEIRFKTNYPDLPELKVPVNGNIRPAVEARPNELNFGRVPKQQIDRLKEQKRPMTRPVMVILNKGNDLQVMKTHLGKGLFKATFKPLQEGRMIQVVLEADFEKLKTGKNEDVLEIFTNQKGNEVFKVPVHFEIQ
jgi:hypothetical protein